LIFNTLHNVKFDNLLDQTTNTADERVFYPV